MLADPGEGHVADLQVVLVLEEHVTVAEDSRQHGADRIGQLGEAGRVVVGAGRGLKLRVLVGNRVLGELIDRLDGELLVRESRAARGTVGPRRSSRTPT